MEAAQLVMVKNSAREWPPIVAQLGKKPGTVPALFV